MSRSLSKSHPSRESAYVPLWAGKTKKKIFTYITERQRGEEDGDEARAQDPAQLLQGEQLLRGRRGREGAPPHRARPPLRDPHRRRARPAQQGPRRLR